MKVIIAGSREVVDYEYLLMAIDDSMWGITEVVSGSAKGADKLGERWALEYGVQIKKFFPDWKSFGKSAGLKRNEEMVDYADGLIALWNKESKGTKHMIETALDKGIQVCVRYCNQEEME